MMSWSLELCNEKPHCHYHWTYFEIGIEWDFSMPCSVLARICCPYYPHMLCCPWYFCGILFGCGSLSCNKYRIICCSFLKSWNQIAGICHWVSCCGSCSACVYCPNSKLFVLLGLFWLLLFFVNCIYVRWSFIHLHSVLCEDQIICFLCSEPGLILVRD